MPAFPAKHKSERAGRTIAIITGLKAGDPSVLSSQPLIFANIAYEYGRTDRRTFLAACAGVIKTKQPIGRLFSFHKPSLIDGGYIRYEKIMRPAWRKELKEALA